MNRVAFRKAFRTIGSVVTPVIHVLDAEQTYANIAIAVRAGAAGIFLINHDFEKEKLLPIIRQVRETWPPLWLGVNFLGITGKDAFPILGQMRQEGCQIDAYWADDARIDEREEGQSEADEIAAIRATSGWDGLYFGGVAFKKQRPVASDGYGRAAQIAHRYLDVVTTSGQATGIEAEDGKIAAFRASLSGAPLALASGITPENAARYANAVDCFLVATGINVPGDFYTIDPSRLAALLATTRGFGAETWRTETQDGDP